MQNKRPNVVFILADDLGYWSLGCTGNREAVTPNLDRMAKEGLMLEHFFCASPVCSPARATLLTGRMPSVHGVLDWLDGGNIATATEPAIEYLKNQRGYTDYLCSAGYSCGLSGKWHLGHSVCPQKGFEHWYTHQYGGGSYYGAPMVQEGETIKEEGYVTRAITQDAVRFLNQQSEAKPFYLSVHYTAPHTPWCDSHPEQYTNLYRGCAFKSCPEFPTHPWQIDFEEFRQDRTEMLMGYFAAISAMDEGVGQILEVLQQKGLAGNTLVIFTSDNGINCGHHGIWGKGNGTNPINLYDTSIRVPFLAWMPGRVPRGKAEGLYSAYDVFPTLLEFCGVTHEEVGLPGISFAALLNGEKAVGAVRKSVAIYDEYGAVRALRSKKWKYIRRWPDGPDELYDLQNDPEEYQNMVDKADESLLHWLQREMDLWFSHNCRPETDGRFAGVTGAGQIKNHTAEGFAPDSFNPQYPASH